MTVIVAYAPRPEGEAALATGIDLARRRGVRLVVLNTSEGGTHADPDLVGVPEATGVERRLAEGGVEAEFVQLVRGRTLVEELNALVERESAGLVVIGLRRRSPVGKLVLGSNAQDILMNISCPILVVRAGTQTVQLGD